MNHFDPQVVDDEAAAPQVEGMTSDEGHGSLGQRLCAAREARGWTRAEVAAKLKLPLALVGKLEGDDYEGLTEGVFLAGYLASYARLVNIPVEQATTVAAANSRLAPLVATGTVSRSRYLLDRYSVSATYLILTAIIVVPAVWLATHGGLEQNLARTTPLDPPAATSSSLALPEPVGIANRAGARLTGETSVAAAPANVPAPATQAPAAPITVPTPADQQPVIASMTPFATAPAVPASTPVAESSAPKAEPVGTGSHSMTLKLSQDSWVEILGENGQRIEYSMLAAGTERSYRSHGNVSVRLGNAQGAELVSDGQRIELAPFQRGNVAYLKLSAGSARRVE